MAKTKPKQKPKEEVVVSPESVEESTKSSSEERGPESSVMPERQTEMTETQIQELRKMLENMDIAAALKGKVTSQAQDLKTKEDEEKIKSLLEITKSKGVIFAIHVAQKLDNPYVLDRFHDILAQQGFYKNFL